MSTVWKSNNFSFAHILREISESKNGHFDILKGIWIWQKSVVEMAKVKIKTSKSVKITDFETQNSAKSISHKISVAEKHQISTLCYVTKRPLLFYMSVEMAILTHFQLAVKITNYYLTSMPYLENIDLFSYLMSLSSNRPPLKNE